MPDKEKVKKGLDICTSKEPCNGCPYLKERNCSLAMVADALALLKEQDVAYQGAVELLRQKTILFDDAIKRLKEQETEIERLKTPTAGDNHIPLRW